MKEIVIKIDENKWNYAREHNFLDMGSNELANAIINGTELPKGHGRLIDADAFAQKLKEASIQQRYDKLFSDNLLSVGDVFDAIIADLKGTALCGFESAPTIIEADKEYEIKAITRGNCMICGKELTEGLFFCKECEAKGK